MVHCVKTPRLATALRSLLTPVGGGLLVGDVSRRVADTLVERIDQEVWEKGGRATVITQSRSPQKFTVREFGHQRVREIDGLQLARIRVSEKKKSRPQQEKCKNRNIG